MTDPAKRRRWTRQTEGSYMLSARIPNGLAEELKNYVDQTGRTISAVMVSALSVYLGKVDLEEGGREE